MRTSRAIARIVSQPVATMSDLDKLALGMPEATKQLDDGRPTYLVHGDGAALVLEVLHQRDHCPRGHGGAVQRRDVLDLPVTASADADAARLVVGRIRGRSELAVPLLPREPALDVVLLGGGGAEI